MLSLGGSFSVLTLPDFSWLIFLGGKKKTASATKDSDIFPRLMDRRAVLSVDDYSLNWPCWLHKNVPGWCFSPVVGFQSGPDSIVHWLCRPSSFDHMCLAALWYSNFLSPSLIRQLSYLQIKFTDNLDPTNVDRHARLPCSSARNHLASSLGWDIHF